MMKYLKQIRSLLRNEIPVLRTIAFYKSLGFMEFSEIGCCGFMRC